MERAIWVSIVAWMLSASCCWSALAARTASVRFCLLGSLLLGDLAGGLGLVALVVDLAEGAVEAVGDVGVVLGLELDVELAARGGDEVVGVEHR